MRESPLWRNLEEDHLEMVSYVLYIGFLASLSPENRAKSFSCDGNDVFVETVAFQAHLLTEPSVAVGETVVFETVLLNQGSGLVDFIIINPCIYDFLILKPQHQTL